MNIIMLHIKNQTHNQSSHPHIKIKINPIIDMAQNMNFVLNKKEEQEILTFILAFYVQKSTNNLFIHTGFGTHICSLIAH